MSTSKPAFAVAAVAALSIVTAACSAPTAPVPARVRLPHGLFAGLHGRYGGRARLTSAPPPASAALPGASDLLAAGRVVLAATDQGIWRSADGGASWRLVLTGIRAWSLTAVPAGGYAAIGDRPARNGPGPAVLATSADGMRWRIMRVRASGTRAFSSFGYGYRFALTGLGPTAVGLAVPDVLAYWPGGTPMRSTDGGRAWAPIALPRASRSLREASTGLAIADGGRTMFVTAPGSGTRCAGAVYRSADAGATWALLPGSCQRYPLMAVQFINARTGFAAGGMPSKFGGAQVVEFTSDGGRTWHTRWRTSRENGPRADDGIVRLDMVTARRGWALTGGCVGGQNGPCGGLVYATTDGGFRWYRTGQGATSIAALGTGRGRALAGADGADVLAITADGGRIWSRQAPPRWVRTTAFSGIGSAQLWANTLGGYLSGDAGARWSGARWLGTARFSYQTVLAAPSGRLLSYSESLVTLASSDGGQTWTSSAVPDRRRDDQLLTVALGTGGTAFAATGAGAECATSAEIRRTEQVKPGWKPPPGRSALFTSEDGGARWRPAGVVLPFGVGFPAASAADGRRVAIVDACGRLQLSADGGLRWHAESLGKSVFCEVSVLRSAVWLSCQSDLTAFWVLHSIDGGATWTVYRLPVAAAANGISTGGPAPAADIGQTGIFATGPDSAIMPAGGSIWRTTDGGRSWTQSWPALPG
ncbi:MAG TPA: hypothetical protein VN840_15930 [Streptosporangiaceae bacterium]|nr:hypothetical protein [Streptosporangiaceae bacterium]